MTGYRSRKTANNPSPGLLKNPLSGRPRLYPPPERFFSTTLLRLGLTKHFPAFGVIGFLPAGAIIPRGKSTPVGKGGPRFALPSMGGGKKMERTIRLRAARHSPPRPAIELPARRPERASSAAANARSSIAVDLPHAPGSIRADRMRAAPAGARASIPPAPAGIDPPFWVEPTRAARRNRPLRGPGEFLKNWIKLYKFTTFFDKFLKIYLIVF